MKGLFIPGITAEMFRNGCLEAIEALMAEGEIYDIDYDFTQPEVAKDTNVPTNDCISRQAAIDAYGDWYVEEGTEEGFIGTVKQLLEGLPSAQPEIIRCKDCKYYSQMNRETKTGICNLTMHQNFGDEWFCAGAERRTDG